MKKKSVIILIVLLLVTIISVTYAYIVRETNTSSVITFGSLKMELIETTIKDGKEVRVSNNDDMDISNTNTVSRIVKVKNIGNHPMFVRISLNIEGKTKNKENIDTDNIVSMDIKENWLYKDGYYYYNKILNPDEITSELIDEIVFNNSYIVENYKNSKFTLDIKAEAVQSEHNKENVLEAVGWPE